MEYLDGDSEFVLKSIIELEERNFTCVLFDYICIKTIDKVKDVNDLKRIINYLVKLEYINPMATQDNNLVIFYTSTQKGKSYFKLKASDKHRKLADWLKIFVSALIGAGATLFGVYLSNR